GGFVIRRIASAKRIAYVLGRIPSKRRRRVRSMPRFEQSLIKGLRGIRCYRFLPTAPGRGRFVARDGSQTVQEMLVPLAEQQAERRCFDLVVLLRSVAHQRTPHIRGRI